LSSEASLQTESQRDFKEPGERNVTRSVYEREPVLGCSVRFFGITLPGNLIWLCQPMALAGPFVSVRDALCLPSSPVFYFVDSWHL
jgi:hypothetical protein